MSDPVESTIATRPSLLAKTWQWGVRWRFALGLAAIATVFLLSSIPNARPPRIRGLDKFQHVVEYFLLTLVFLNVTTRGFVHWRWGAYLATGLAAVALAAVDETYQRFVPRRAFDLWDVAFSSLGVLLAMAGALLLRRIVPGLIRTRTRT